MPEPVQRSLQDIACRDRVDHLCATFSCRIRLQQCLFRRNRAEPFVPEVMRSPAKSGCRARFRAKARVDCARGPSLPSMLRGRPRTRPARSRFAMISTSSAASCVNLERLIVTSGVATLRNASETATPIVLVPKSRPAIPRAGGSAAAKPGDVVVDHSGASRSVGPPPRSAPARRDRRRRRPAPHHRPPAPVRHDPERRRR
jgi:hypothetical protein